MAGLTDKEAQILGLRSLLRRMNDNTHEVRLMLIKLQREYEEEKANGNSQT